ncbi:MAG TPA: tagaturonate reductase [Chitinophagaceae bacterium]
MRLSKNNIEQIAKGKGLDVPDKNLLELPEKVLQFGTGVLLRALPDYFIDKANKQGLFNGRVVIVKSTDSDSSAFDLQDGLYTVCVRGIEDGKTVEENIINASVSRVLGAKTEWPLIMKCACNPEMKIIISNTTEVGIQLVADNINSEPPVSFPGKLLAFLFERFRAFNGSKESGMVIVPTELITDNGTKLESILLELAHQNNLDFKFIEWLENYNTFCNSLVDRIVPGRPNAAEIKRLEAELGYEDELLTMSEVFRLWAIEGDENVKEILCFSKADEGVIITPDITLFKELKLRLLNGTHTFNCGLAFLSGFTITREAMNDPVYRKFSLELMHNEIAPAIPFDIDKKVKEDFANKVFERFCNPFVEHQWQSITVQYTSKMKMRNIPLLKRHYELYDSPPAHMAAGFAGFLLYMKAIKKEDGKYFGQRGDQLYEIKDDSLEYFFRIWENNIPDKVAEIVMQNEELWETDLTKLPGFLGSVQEYLKEFLSNGVLKTIARIEPKTAAV